jgi:hypothetical protein
MLTQRSRLLPLALLSLMTLLLVGCGGPNLFDRFNHPWGYGCCGLIVLILDVIAIIEVVGSTRDVGGKVLWILIILFFPVLGCILYYVFGR